MSQAEVTREEFVRLETRVSTIEQEAEGETMLSRYILSQARQNGDDLAALKTRVDRIEEKVDRLEQRVVHIDLNLGALRRDLPSIVGDVMRDVLTQMKSV